MLGLYRGATWPVGVAHFVNNMSRIPPVKKEIHACSHKFPYYFHCTFKKQSGTENLNQLRSYRDICELIKKKLNKRFCICRKFVIIT